MNNNFYDMEREGRAAYQLDEAEHDYDRLDIYGNGDQNCEDCGQTICACESLADWHREREETEAFTHEEAEQRRAWLREAHLDQGHLHI